MSNNIFQRTEKKYVLRQEQFCNLQIGINKRMKQDEYGHHTICNIYFDTDCFDLIRTSLEKPLYKEKLRIRSYGIPTENGKVFLELKKKYDGVVYKRRQECSWKDAKRYLILNEQLRQSTQILNELEENEIYPTSFSKYGKWYEFHSASFVQLGGVINA